MTRHSVLLFCMIALWIPAVGLGESRCPREIPPVEYQPLEHSQIGVPVRSTASGARPSLELFTKIASDRKTSLSAAGWKFCDFTSERCALVWSRSGRVEWSKASKEFEFFLCGKDLLDERSLAAQSFRSRKQISPDRVLAAVWLDSNNLIEDATIHEDSRWLPSYESVITLLTIPKRIELRTEFDDEDEEPLDPSDFTVYRRRWPR